MANPNRTLPGLGLRWMNVGEDDWGPDYNEDHRILSALVNNSVKSRTTDAPAITPTVGDIYIVPASATGDFAGQDEAIAIWDGDIGSEAWVFITPAEGWTLYVLDEDLNYQFDGTVWSEFSSGAGVTYLDRVLIDMAVIDASLATPPGSPSDGDAYIVAATATGDWAGQEDNIAIYEDTAWVFYTPMEGYILRDQANNLTYQFDGLVWAEFNLASLFTTIVNSEATSGYQIVGDILMCWGLDQQTGAPRTITFPKAFKTGTTPRMTTGTRVNAARFVTIEAIDATSADITAYTDTGGSSNAETMWIAIGEAADADKMPKEVGGVTEITVDNNGLELIGVYDLSTFTLDSGNELEVNVEAYSQLIVDVQAATFGTADNIKMQASDDGGATYFTGSTDYERWNFTNSSEDLGLDQNSIGIVPSGNTDSTAYWIFTGLNNQDTPISGFGFSGATANFAQRHRLQASHSGINAIKFFSGSGNAATGGKLILYGVPKEPESRQALGFVERTYTATLAVSGTSGNWAIPDNCIRVELRSDTLQGTVANTALTFSLDKASGGNTTFNRSGIAYNSLNTAIANADPNFAFTRAWDASSGEFFVSATILNPRAAAVKTNGSLTALTVGDNASNHEVSDSIFVADSAQDDDTLTWSATDSISGTIQITYTVLEAEVGYKKPTITTTTPLSLADVPALAEIDTSAGNLTVTLPTNAPQGTIWNGIIIDATNVVTVSAPSGENLDGVTDGSGDMTQALGAEASFRKTSVGWFSTGDMGVVS